MQVFADLGTREVTEKVLAFILDCPLKVSRRENERSTSTANSEFACFCKRGEDRRGNTVTLCDFPGDNMPSFHTGVTDGF